MKNKLKGCCEILKSEAWKLRIKDKTKGKQIGAKPERIMLHAPSKEVNPAVTNQKTLRMPIFFFQPKQISKDFFYFKGNKVIFLYIVKNKILNPNYYFFAFKKNLSNYIVQRKI